MEVKAVSSVVTQKLLDMMHEESVPDIKVVTRQLNAVQESHAKLQCFSMEENNSDTSLENEHLRILYEIEDEVEKFSFRAARQKKKFGFLMKQALLFNNLNSRYKLHQRMKNIRSKIKRINQSHPPAVEGATPSSTITSSLHSDFDNERSSQHNSLRSISDASAAEISEEEYDSNDDDDQDPRTPSAKSLSAIWPIPDIQSSRSPKCSTLTRSLSAIPDLQKPMSHQKKLTFSYSHDEEEINFVGIQEERLQYHKTMSTFSYEEEELGIVGFDADVNSLVERLTEQEEKFVPVLGEVGSGKTSLLRAVYRKRKIKDHFELHFWVSVSKEDTTKHILLSLLKKVAASKDIGAISQEQQVLKKELFNHLKEKKYLIVLDGLGSYGMLEDLKDDVSAGSKIIFTCEVWRSQEKNLLPHHMKPLSEDESWNLFLKKAGKDNASAQIPQKMKCRILDICKGLPLNIVLVAGLLSTKRIRQWPFIIVHGKSSDDVLSLCYNDLKDVSKVCLLYMAFFPKEYDIPVRRLLRLWLAEGFAKRRTQELPEDFIQKLFEDLVNRSLIQITKLRSDNSPRRCRLVDVLHDYLLPKAKDTSLFHIHRNLECCEDAVGPFGIRRMIQYVGTMGTCTLCRGANTKAERGRNEKDVPNSAVSSLSHFFSSRRGSMNTETSYPNSIPFNPQQTHSDNSVLNPSLLRTFVSFNIQRRDTPGKEVGTLLSRIIGSGFGLLRVLDLEGVCRPSLPQNLGHLCHLRYLGLRWTFLESLPKSVGDLTYLETLDVKHTYIDSLPDSIWKLKHLRNLNLNNIRLALPPSSSSTLLTLWGLFVDEKISVKEGLGKLQALRELGITFNLNTSQNVLIDLITRLTDLQSLRLRSVDGMVHPSKLFLKSLSTLGKLSHLNLLGNLERLPNKHEFPPTLKVLTLSVSRLNDDPMETLGELPCLMVLRLLANSYTGKKMVCRRGGFKKLRVLKLWMLKELEEWNAEEETMENLKELDIRCCLKLKNIPSRLLQEGGLDELTLTGMPDEFKTSVMERKSKYTSLTINPWKFTPLPVNSCFS